MTLTADYKVTPSGADLGFFLFARGTGMESGGQWGREVLQRSSGAEPRWGSGSEAPRSPKNVTSWGWKNTYGEKQELSYREQIASQLRTQFVQGISVTLKSTLRVTQGHWKRNHLTDHIHDLQYDELFTLWRNVTSGNRPKHGPKASA